MRACSRNELEKTMEIWLAANAKAEATNDRRCLAE